MVQKSNRVGRQPLLRFLGRPEFLRGPSILGRCLPANHDPRISRFIANGEIVQTGVAEPEVLTRASAGVCVQGIRGSGFNDKHSAVVKVHEPGGANRICALLKHAFYLHEVAIS